MIEGNDVIHRPSLKKVHITRKCQNGGRCKETDGDANLQESGQPQFAVPDEILAMVFNHLSLRDRYRLSFVNNQWHRCAFLYLPKFEIWFGGCFDGTNYMDVTDGLVAYFLLKDRGHVKATKLLGRLRGSKIEHVTFHFFNEPFTEQLLCFMAEIAQRAHTVSVWYNTRHDFSITFAELPGIKLPPLNDFVSVCKVLGPNITYLNFNTAEDMTKFSGDTFRDILANLKKLKGIRGHPLSLLLPFQGTVPYHYFQQLEEVHILDLHYDDPNMRVSWRGFIDRFKSQLRKFSISAQIWTLNSREEDLLADIRHFNKLECFCLTRDNWSNYKLRYFVPVLRELATACPRLTTLQLTWNGTYVALNAIKCLFIAMRKIKQLQTVNLDLVVLLLQKCDELSILRMLRNVADANNLRRDIDISQHNFFGRRVILRVCGSMGLVLSNNAPEKRTFRYFGRKLMNVCQRCETYYI